MKKLLILTLAVLLPACLCACNRTNVRDPLVFIPAEEDGAFLTDRGILRVDDGFVTAGALMVQLTDGSFATRKDGTVLDLPDRENWAATAMTVGQARSMMEELFRQVTPVLGSAGYLLECCPADSSPEAPDYTYSVLDKTLTEGRQQGVDEGLGSFVVNDAGPVARIWIKP